MYEPFVFSLTSLHLTIFFFPSNCRYFVWGILVARINKWFTGLENPIMVNVGTDGTAVNRTLTTTSEQDFMISYQVDSRF